MNSKLEQDDGEKAHGKNKSEGGSIVIVQGNISPERWRENPLYNSIAVVILRYDLRCVPRCRSAMLPASTGGILPEGGRFGDTKERILNSAKPRGEMQRPFVELFQ